MENLSNKQLLSINHILSSATIEEASRKSGVSRGTIYNWLKDEKFSQELKRQRDQVIEEALNHLKVSVTKAVGELIKLMGAEREEVRRLACNDVISHALKSVELENLEERLDKVERIVLERKTYR
jgi:transcriptional regulator with XRE-family HTH domain